jgi:hypothetical protein
MCFPSAFYQLTYQLTFQLNLPKARGTGAREVEARHYSASYADVG